jgi:hypothetical protein
MRPSFIFFAGIIAVTKGLVHELVVGNFVNDVLYTLKFDDELYSLDLISNISVATRNSWIAFNVSNVTIYLMVLY